MPRPAKNRDHQARTTRFSKDGTFAIVVLQVDRRAYEFARMLARFHHAADPTATAETHLMGYLNTAMTGAMETFDWRSPPEIEALYPAPRALRPNDLDDDIPF